jgi:hypothetical protein
MSAALSQRYCRDCRKKTLHQRAEAPGAGCAGHILLAAVTCGLWIPVAIFLGGLSALTGAGHTWNCTACGRRN